MTASKDFNGKALLELVGKRPILKLMLQELSTRDRIKPTADMRNMYYRLVEKNKNITKRSVYEEAALLAELGLGTFDGRIFHWDFHARELSEYALGVSSAKPTLLPHVQGQPAFIATAAPAAVAGPTNGNDKAARIIVRRGDIVIETDAANLKAVVASLEVLKSN